MLMSKKFCGLLVAKLGALSFLLLYSSPVMAAAEGVMTAGAQDHAWWEGLEAVSSLFLLLAGFSLSISIL